MIKFSKQTVLTREQAKFLFGWSEDPFEGRQYGLQWVSEGTHYLARLDGAAVSHVATLPVTIKTDQDQFSVLGFGGVITNIHHQRRGYGAALMEYAAQENVDILKKSPGMLFCAEKKLSFYAKLGWKKKGNAVWVKQPAGDVRMPLFTMILNPADLPWPDGELRSASLPW